MRIAIRVSASEERDSLFHATRNVLRSTVRYVQGFRELQMRFNAGDLHRFSLLRIALAITQPLTSGMQCRREIATGVLPS